MVRVNIRAKVMVSSEYEGGTIYHSKICSGGTISVLIMGPVKIITALDGCLHCSGSFSVLFAAFLL